MTGDIKTTPSGLSEGILWNFAKDELADFVLDYYGISTDLVSDIVPTFSIQGQLTGSAAEQLGLKSGTPVSYRAGDQPNNAFSLKAAVRTRKLSVRLRRLRRSVPQQQIRTTTPRRLLS